MRGSLAAGRRIGRDCMEEVEEKYYLIVWRRSGVVELAMAGYAQRIY